MMEKITLNDFNRILEDAKKMGHSLRMSDIFYAIGVQSVEDNGIVYAVLFGKGSNKSDVDLYDKSPKIKFLKKYMESNHPVSRETSVGKTKRGRPKKEDNLHDDITFEENKAYMLKLKKETEEAIEKGEIEKKDGLKILADLSVKLNDKFSVSEKQDEQRVIVNSKYNDICPYCSHEIRRKTDDDMLEEIKEKYILTPKQGNDTDNDE